MDIRLVTPKAQDTLAAAPAMHKPAQVISELTRPPQSRPQAKPVPAQTAKPFQDVVRVRPQATHSSAIHRPKAAPRREQPAQSEAGAKSRHVPRVKLKMTRQTAVLYAMAGVLFIAGAVVTFNGFKTNQHVAAQIETAAPKSSSTGDTGDDDRPSAKKPSVAAVRNYTVAPNMPRYVDIPKLGKHARIIPVGVKSDGSMGTPNNIYDIGWYNGSNLPGQPGAMLLDGHFAHISTYKAQGTFYAIGTLKAGDKVKVTRGDGKVLTYKVVKKRLFDHKKVDMASALVSVDTAKPGLNMITCAGNVIPGTYEYNKRLIVYAVQV